MKNTWVVTRSLIEGGRTAERVVTRHHLGTLKRTRDRPPAESVLLLCPAPPSAWLHAAIPVWRVPLIEESSSPSRREAAGPTWVSLSDALCSASRASAERLLSAKPWEG